MFSLVTNGSLFMQQCHIFTIIIVVLTYIASTRFLDGKYQIFTPKVFSHKDNKCDCLCENPPCSNENYDLFFEV